MSDKPPIPLDYQQKPPKHRGGWMIYLMLVAVLAAAYDYWTWKPHQRPTVQQGHITISGSGAVPVEPSPPH